MNLIRTLLCAAVTAAALTVSCFAADIQIVLNSQPITFTDATPMIVHDRTYLPFRTVFTALGFQDENITFDDSSQTVRARGDDLTVSMVIGENAVTVVRNGETSTLKTDVPAFIDPQVNRTYVPTRFVSEAVGYRVGWDGETSTVLIDDVDQLLASDTEAYTWLDRLLDYERKTWSGNRSTEGNYTIFGSVSGEDAAMQGAFRMVSAETGAFDLTTRMNLVGLGTESALAQDVDLELRGNFMSGETVFQSSDLVPTVELNGQNHNIWYTLDSNPFSNSPAGQLPYFLLFQLENPQKNESGKTWIGRVLRQMLEEQIALPAKDALDNLHALFADRSLTSETGSSERVSTLTIPTGSLRLSLNTRDRTVTGMAFSVETSGDNAMTMQLTVQNDHMELSLHLTGEQNITLSANGTYKTSSRAPQAMPNADSIVEMGVLYGTK